MIHKDFYERGRYVAHNRDVGILPRVQSFNKTVLRQPPSCAASQIREPAWPALVAVATCYMIMMTKLFLIYTIDYSM